jgi:hypothetical protein
MAFDSFVPIIAFVEFPPNNRSAVSVPIDRAHQLEGPWGLLPPSEPLSERIIPMTLGPSRDRELLLDRISKCFNAVDQGVQHLAGERHRY